jgi:hypothetical protein
VAQSVLGESVKHRSGRRKLAILLPLPCIMAVTASLIVAKLLDQHITREPTVTGTTSRSIAGPIFRSNGPRRQRTMLAVTARCQDQISAVRLL